MFNLGFDKNARSVSPNQKTVPDLSHMPQSSMLRARAMMRRGFGGIQQTSNTPFPMGQDAKRTLTPEANNQNQPNNSQTQIKQNAFLQLFGNEQPQQQQQVNLQAITPEKIRDFSSNQALGSFVSVVVNNIVTKIQAHGYWEKEAQQLFAKRLDTETFVNLLVEEIEKIGSKFLEKEKLIASLTKKLSNLESIMNEKFNRIVAADRDRLTLQENHLRDHALKAETHSDFLQNENKELKKNLDATKKNEQYYLSEVERLNNKATDQAGEIAELKSKYNKLKLKNQELRGLGEMHNTMDYWRKKYEQLEKEYKSELNTKESNIHTLYKTEFDSRLKSYNLNHKKEKDAINESVLQAQQEVMNKQKQIDDLNKQIEDLKIMNADHVHEIETWKQKYNNLQRKYFENNKLLTELPKQNQEETNVLKEKIRDMERAHKDEILEMKNLFEQTLQQEREAREREYNSRLMGDKRVMKSQLTESQNENDQKNYNIKVLTKDNDELRAANSDLRDEVIILRNRYNLLEERAKKQISELKAEVNKLQKQDSMFDDLKQKKDLEAAVHEHLMDQLKKSLLDQDLKTHALMAENTALKNRLFKLTGQDVQLSSVHAGQ